MPRVLILLLVATIAVAAQETKPPQETKPAPQFTADGKLKLPADYREWVYVTSGVGMSYSAMAVIQQRVRPSGVVSRVHAHRQVARSDDVRARIAGVVRAGIDPRERSLSEGGRRHRSVGERRAPV